MSLFLIFLLTLLRVYASEADLQVNITKLYSATEIGAVCLDGSPPAYHLHRGTGSGLNNWLIQLEGGGWCDSISDCLSRSVRTDGSSKYMPDQILFSGILSNNSQLNPDFYHWNRVKVKYCDGSSFTGDVEEVDPATNLYFRGARIFQAIVEDLLDKGMKDVQAAILSGTSAGGLAAIMNCDKFKHFLPLDAKVKCISDAGFFVNVRTISGEPHIEDYYKRVVNLHGSAKNLPIPCTSDVEPSLCFFPQYAAKYVYTPLFIINSAYDSLQVNNILVPEVSDPQGLWKNCKNDTRKCSPSQIIILQEYRLKFLEALNGLGPSSSRGYFITSCNSHGWIERQSYWSYSNSPTLCNKTIGEATGDWFFDRSGFKKIDCPYPCGKFCH